MGTKKITAFISVSHQDRVLVDALLKQLREHGIAVCSAPEHFEALADWQREVAPKMQAAEVIIVMINPQDAFDRCQDREWQEALQARWDDSGKRFIPVLFANAELPGFLPSQQAIRVPHPDDGGGWVTELVRMLRDPQRLSADAQALEERAMERHRKWSQSIDQMEQQTMLTR